MAKGTTSYGVIGGGISGLACARVLAASGARVVVFDKARKPGGRVSTRRSAIGGFDHGAQYFTARTPDFSSFVDDCVSEGAAAEWRPRLAKLDVSGLVPVEDDTVRYVGTPGMSAVARRLAEGVECICSRRAVRIGRSNEGWRVGFEDGGIEGPFDRLVVALPSAQAAELLPPSGIREAAASVEMTGAWALMLTFAGSVDVPFDAAWVSNSPIAWLANDSSKPERAGGVRWVVHSTPQWFHDTEEAEPSVVEQHLVGAFAAMAHGPLPHLVGHMLHRWRYALPPEPLAAPFLYDAELGIGACGDWCGGPRVEGAFVSGTALAQHLTSSEESASQ